MGGGADKLLLQLEGRPVVAWSLLGVVASGSVERVLVMASAANREALRAATAGLGPVPVEVVDGGDRRQDSVRLGLEHLAPDPPVAVLVHDGARPLVDPALVRACAEAALAGGSVTSGVPLKDSVKEVDGAGMVVRSFRRASMFAIQTPQAFPFQVLHRAHLSGGGIEVDDDAELVERLGEPVRLIGGEYRNLKLTTPDDVELAAAHLRAIATSG
jgi:2-C-methyl-D-erythritol 4-phosphate cytidylyltransferase